MLRHITTRGQLIPINPVITRLNRSPVHALGKQMSTERLPDTINYIDSTNSNEGDKAEDHQFSQRLQQREYKKTPSQALPWLNGKQPTTFDTLQQFGEQKIPNVWRRSNKKPSRPRQTRRSIEEGEADFAEEFMSKGAQEEVPQWEGVDLNSIDTRPSSKSGPRRRRPKLQQQQPGDEEVKLFSAGFEKGGMKRPSAAPRRGVGPRRGPKKGTSLYGDKEGEEEAARDDREGSMDDNFWDVDAEDMRLFRQLTVWRNPVTHEEPGKPALFQDMKTGYDIFAEERTEFRLNDYTATVTVNGPTTTPYFQIGGPNGDYEGVLPKGVQNLASVDSATLSPIDAARFTLALAPDMSQKQREDILNTIHNTISRSQARKSQPSAS
ncbi:hypothetical protein FRC19_006267 [Serendipita sp. 401]|nr:hypothetical protein FRC19_006267 [Serendipita sp. 401]